MGHIQNLQEDIRRWQQYVEEQFQNPEDQLTPEIIHDAEQTWGNFEKSKPGRILHENTPNNRKIRTTSHINELLAGDLQILTWINNNYTAKTYAKQSQNSTTIKRARAWRNSTRRIRNTYKTHYKSHTI